MSLFSMPGWSAHSYGYHGDDGRKFGANSTSSEWTVFALGDIIGCGFDMTRRAIFYTRNGVLLGDGFVDVAETELWPVIGFSNRHDDTIKVAINFGVKAFMYQGSEVVANAAAVLERVVNIEDTNEGLSLAPSASIDIEAVQSTPVEDIVLIRTDVQDLNRESDEVGVGTIDESSYVLELNKLLSQVDEASSFVFEMKNLAVQSALILRFLLEISCQADTEAETIESTPTTATAFVKPILSKAISVFGTPKFVNLADSTMIRHNLLMHVIQELQLSVDYSSQPKTDVRSLASLNYLLTAADADRQSSDFSDETPVLDNEDMEGMIYFHLQTLAATVSGSKTIREELSFCQPLKLFFSILHNGSIRNRTLACNLLIKLLPTVSPDVADSAIIDPWIAVNAAYEAKLIPPSYRQRQRRMPDSIVQALYLTTARELTADCSNADHWKSLQERWYSPSKECFPYGFGAMTIQFVDQKLHLIRTLFEAPLWSELVACCITETFRNAALVLERTVIEDESFVANETDKEILQLACSACLSLCGIGTLFPGATIVTQSDICCKLISHSSEAQHVTVVPLARLSNFDSAKYVESIATSSIRSSDAALQADLSHHSQPMLQHLFSILQKLLTWISKQGTSLVNRELTIYERTQLRLTSTTSLLLSSLLSHQSDVVTDFIQDAKIIRQIVSIALMPVELNYLPKAQFVNNLWIYFQSRNLESNPFINVEDIAKFGPVIDGKDQTLEGEIKGTVGSASNINGTGDKSALSVVTSDLLEDEPIVTSPTKSIAIDISLASRKVTEEKASILSAELEIPQHICTMHLEFFGMDFDEAKSSLLKLKHSIEFAEDYSHDFKISTATTETVEADDSVLKNVDSANFNPDNTFPSELPDHLYLERLILSNKYSQENLLVVESNEEGYINGTSKQLALCSHFGDDLSKIVVSTFDGSKGTVISSLADTMSYRSVKKLYGFERSSINKSILLLDMSVTILRIRSIASRLLCDGNLNLEQDSSDINNWPKLLKLILAYSSVSDVSKNFELNCSALLSRTSSNLLHSSIRESTFINMFIEDVKENLRLLSRPDYLCEAWNKFYVGDTEDGSSSPLVFCSPHPFLAPYSTVGRIVIPKSWKTISVNFSPLCSTPSADASLAFFTSDLQFQAGTPAYEYYGTNSDSTQSNFKDFILYDVNVLVYKFRAKPQADKLRAQWIPLPGNVKTGQKDSELFIVEEKPSSIDVASVGLGDDDSLFNLFSDSTVAPRCNKVSTVVLDCDPFSAGSWYFEVTVAFVADSSPDATEFLRQRVGLMESSVGETSSEGTKENFIGISTNGTVYRNSEVIIEDANLADWKNQDVISCLFKIDEKEGYQIRFARNGIWSAPCLFDVAAKALQPAITLTEISRFSPNDGTQMFSYGPSREIMEEFKTFNAICDRPLKTLIKKVAWGYHFAVQPITEPLIECCRDFEPIWNSQAKSDDVVGKHIWIWRPKMSAKFKSCGDILTSTSFPPKRSLLFNKIQCKSPKKYENVFSCTKSNIAIWRPIPPPGYVALGDFATTCSSSSPSMPSVDLLCCIPLWAVSKCNIRKKMVIVKKVGDSKSLMSVSFWSIDTNLGHFFASPYEQQKGTGLKVDGVGEGYSLKLDTSSLLEGEWFNESEVVSKPSLLWSCNMIQFLLGNPASRLSVLNDDLFFSLVKYLKSTAAPAPLNILSTLIRMIRTSFVERIDLNLGELSGLCKAILAHAATLSLDKKAVYSKAFMRLIDFVVEVQVSFIAKSISKDQMSHRKCGNRTIEIVQESSEITTSEENADSSKSISFAISSLSSARTTAGTMASSDFTTEIFTNDWWKRSNFNSQVVKENRVIRKENVENLFARESAILKLRQTLKFLNAIGSFDPPSSIMNKEEVKLAQPYPKFMTSKIWFDYASFCILLESKHPYDEKNSFKRNVFVAGAKKFSVNFDQRTSLKKGHKLTLSCGESTFSITHTTSADQLQKAPPFKGDTLNISFEVSADSQTDEGEENENWGWALLIHLTGDIFSTSSCTVDLGSLDVMGSEEEEQSEESASLPQANSLKSNPIALPPSEKRELGDALSEAGSDATDGDVSYSLKFKDLFFDESVHIESDSNDSAPILDANRPRTKRGKRLITLAEDKAMQNIDDALTEQKPPLSEAMIRLSTICANGSKVASGVLQVPHALQVELKVDTHFADSMRDFEIVLVVKDESETPEIKYINISKDAPKPETTIFKSSSVYYEIRSMKKAALDAYLNVQKLDTESEKLSDKKQAIKPTMVSDSEVKEEVEYTMVELMNDFWYCTFCTSLNPPAEIACTVCTSARDLSLNDAVSGDATGWWCSACTLINPLANLRYSL